MKKKTYAAAALAVVLTLAGCGSQPAQTTAPATTTTAAPAPETTEAAATTAAAETTEAPADNVESGTVMFTDTSDNVFYKEDAVVGEWDTTFPYTSVRVSSGLFIDSDTNPELFNVEEFSYSGDRAQRGDLVKIKAGDTMGGLKIASASARFHNASDDITDESGQPLPPQFAGSDVEIEGEVTLTGIIRYYYDEMYTIASGDIIFIPDSSYAGMPLATDILQGEWEYGTLSFDEKGTFSEEGGYGDTTYGGGINVYADAPSLRLGNLNENYADRTDLAELFDGAAANCTKKVTVTLTDLKLNWNDNFGSAYSCSAVLKDASVLD